MVRGQVVHKSPGGGLAEWQVDLVVRLLLHDLGEDVPAAGLARRCGLSRSHFVRAFRISVGLPPHRWLVRQRVRRAGELLEGTDDPISTIALSCGFADQSHLARVFHQVVGASPGSWRRQRRAGVTPTIAWPEDVRRFGDVQPIG